MVITNLQFEIKREIGSEGANSKVYIVNDPQLNADLVLKKIPKTDFIDKYGNLDEDKYFNEAKILYDTEHPNIMKVQYASQDKDSIYLTMPYYKNGSLNALLENRYLTVREIVKYSLDFLSGLHFTHTKQLIHFDIKPTNILISDNNKAVLTDFGLAKYVNQYGLASPDRLYRAHKPPEANSYLDFTNKSDIYQAGITLYRLCNGNIYYKQQYSFWNSKGQLNEAIEKGSFPDRKFYLAHIPTKLRRIIKKAIDPDPDKRYSTVLEMINAICTIEENLDWEYTEDKNARSCIWRFSGKTHYEMIELAQNGKEWAIEGKRVRKSDGRQTRRKEWCIKGLVNIAEAMEQVKTFINEF